MINIDVLLGETILEVNTIEPRGEYTIIDFNSCGERYVLIFEEVDFEAVNFMLFEEHSDKEIKVTKEAIKIEPEHYEILFSEIKQTKIYKHYLAINE
ncbi:hypothetical protein ACRZ5S_19685 [Vibrio scophthalmi]|uniref:hypothetical protein n=1 Tax=Vibrio scophthalmi TaxID=45658 RepID=UPI003EB889CA